MNKKILTSLILMLTATAGVAIAQDKVAINEVTDRAAEQQAATENQPEKTEVTVFESVPNLDKMSEKLDKDSKDNVQLDTAKAVSGQISNSLKDSALQAQIEQAVEQVVNVDDCVKIALANNPMIKSSQGNAEIYKTKIAQAWASYFPQIGVGVEYSRNDMLVSSFIPPNQKYNMFYLPTAKVNWMLFDFGKTKANADIAKKTYLATEDNVQASINDVIYNVKKSYYNLLYAIQQEKVYTDSVKNYEIHLAQANAYYKIGTKAKIDVLTAEYNLGKAKLDLIKSKNSVKLAYANVNSAIGIPEFSNYAIDENLETRTYDVLLDDMLKTAFETRPEYLAAQKKSEASQLLVRASKRAFLPDLNAFGSVQYGGRNPGNDTGYQFGANLAYSNFNALLLKKQVDEAKATAKKDAADLETSRQNIYLEVKQAYIDMQDAKDSIPVAQLAMMQAKEQYDLASGRYKVGLGDAVELKDAENTYRQAQLEYYSNLMKYNIAAANLERVTGAPIASQTHEEPSTTEIQTETPQENTQDGNL